MKQKPLSERRVACIRVPNFCWQVEATCEPSLKESGPVLITSSALDLHDGGFGTQRRDGHLSDRVVFDCSPDVTDVAPGMPLEVGLSRHSKAALIQADVPRYVVAFEELLKGLEDIVPAVEDGGPGTAYIDTGGLDRLYGDQGQVIRRLADTARSFDLRIGLGVNKWQSYLASLLSGPHRALMIDGNQTRFVGSFSIEALPVPYRFLKRLRTFGLQQLSDVAQIPQGPMEAQFGLTGRLMWQLANGIDERPLIPRKVAESVSEYLAFPDATVGMSAIFSGIESLLGKAFSSPQMQRRYARMAHLQAQVFRKPPWVMDVAFKEPAGSKNHAILGIKSKLDSVKFPGPLEDMRLTLADLSAEPLRQESMWKEVQKEDNLRQSIGQLAARLGLAPPIYQVRELEPWSRIPERRYALMQLSH